MYFQNVGSSLRECNNTVLRYDRACLQIITNKPVSFWSQYEECEGCILFNTVNLSSTGEIELRTRSPLQYVIQNTSTELNIFNGTYHFGEFGQYSLNLTQEPVKCMLRMTAEPDAAYLPLLTAAAVLLFMASLWYIVKGIGKRLQAGSFYARYIARSKKQLEVTNESLETSEPIDLNTSRIKEDNELGSETRVLTTEASVPRSPIRSRLRSLDTFRGITIALMLFMNAGGGGYDIFMHAVWYGMTVADMMMPWFAFAMGEALVLSLNARLRTAMPRTTAFAQVCRRSLMMACLGIVIDPRDAAWWSVRLPGVLQRLAAMYLVVGALECAFMKTNQDIHAGRSYLRDISAGWPQWLVTLVLVAIQVCITLLVPAPGCPRGYMGPGGLHLSALGKNLTNCTGGIAGYIDRLILTSGHLYRGDFAGVYHMTVHHDPEGILGILSGVLVVQAGAHATRVMLVYNHARARIMRWVFWSLVFGAIGGGLCMFSKNGGPIPLNKNLCSLSFCLVCASTALFAQAVLYFIVDLKNWWGGRPLYYAGQNSLFLFVCSTFLYRNFPFYWALREPTHYKLLATSAATMLLWLSVGTALHRKRVFITL